MDLSPRELGLSWLFVTIIGFLLWPPRFVYWTEIVEYTGETVLIAIIGIISVLLGLAFMRYSGVSILNYISGGIVSYISGMVLIELFIHPVSPVHFVLYGILLFWILAGGASWYICTEIVEFGKDKD